MNITVRDLLDAGVHFGHQRKRWNPKSKEFVYDHRHGVSIIDLEKSYNRLKEACDVVEDLIANDKIILMVGTKRPAQEMIRESANSVQMPYCASRWLGGTLTNFETIKRSIAKYKRYQAMETDGSLAKLPGKEGAAIKREMSRMHRNFEGLQEMGKLPSALFVIDIKHEAIAVAEAKKLNIPVIALVDTNSDPSLVSHPIPGNDDAAKSLRIIIETITEAMQNGLAQRESRRAAKNMPAAARAEIAAEQSEEAAEGVTITEQAPAVEQPAEAAPEVPAESAETPAPEEAAAPAEAEQAPAEEANEAANPAEETKE